jgi:hypothetical protein
LTSNTATANTSFNLSIATTIEYNKFLYLQCINAIRCGQRTAQIWLLSSNDIDGTSITLTEALKEYEEQKRHSGDSTTDQNYPNIVLIALDATWKYANEMDRANIQHGGYPNQCMRRVRLTAVDFQHPLFQSPIQSLTQPSKYNRFTIRTPPRPKTSSTDDCQDRTKTIVHLSTAECLAYVLARIEQNETIYHTVMKPLDLMVRQWQSHYINSDDS